MAESVCRQCHRIVTGQICQVCNSTALTSDWSGYVVIIDPEKSQIAKRLSVNLPGKYALKVR
ncbi:MAG: transcription elongation factor subunit Spt4 [Candidatus Methanoperedens sp.]|jgi:DNA-directed RNA polymerase subunit E"|nr:DNA-directed RNA polymerase, subunit E'' [Candidatus Methanoperedens sp.]